MFLQFERFQNKYIKKGLGFHHMIDTQLYLLIVIKKDNHALTVKYLCGYVKTTNPTLRVLKQTKLVTQLCINKLSVKHYIYKYINKLH